MTRYLARSVVFCLVGCLLVDASKVDAADAPNIILILTDDQGWNGTSVKMDPNIPGSASDYFQTPNLESLAASGMRFSDAYSAAPVCQPTRASLLTGRSPAQLQITSVETTPFVPRNTEGNALKSTISGRIRPEFPTLPERIKLANPDYSTASFGKWHIFGSPANHGYDVSGTQTLQNDPRSLFGITDLAKTFVSDNAAADKPFFMQVAHIAPHRPTQALPETIAKYEALPKGTYHRDAKYAAMIENLDTAIGELLDHVSQAGVADNTYVIFTSDNGATELESPAYPLYRGKGSVWEGGIRVPFIVSGPGIQANSVSRVPVVTTDLYSTIDSLAGASQPLPDGVEGADLSPLLMNGGELPDGMDSLVRQHGEDGALYFHFPHNQPTTVFGNTRPQSAIRYQDYKLVRMYGEGDDEDRNLLFDLRDNLANPSVPTESLSSSSSLNLADDLPELTAELSAKLDRWLESVDASQAYDLRDPISVAWRADTRGEVEQNAIWRSITNVDNKPRETWMVEQKGEDVDIPRPTNETAQITSIGAFQPGLGGEAFSFDGNDAMQRVYFHVSDTDARVKEPSDRDRSISIEMWVRLEDLDDDQLLLESGKSDQGLSLTLGDADSDSSHDDLRFRLRSADGKSIEAVAEIDRFADVTSDFVHLSAVFNDDPNDRYAEIYVNGALASRSVGLSGVEETIHWDGFDLAGLGGMAGESIGGVDGASAFDQTIGGLRGDVALVRYHNHLLTSQEIAEAYSADLSSVLTGIVQTTGDVIVPSIRLTDVSLAGAGTGSSIAVLHERSDELRDDLTVDFVPVGTGVFDLASTLLPEGTIDQGTHFASYLVHFAPDQSGLVSGTIEFASEILGLIVEDSSLSESDSILGSIGIYPETFRSANDFGEATIMLSSDFKTLSFSFNGEIGDLFQLRVITGLINTGDFNNDGIVDAADYTVWRRSLNNANDLAGDGNGDGVVNEADYRIWRSAYGNTLVLQSEAEAIGVPEPSCGLLALLSLLAGCGFYSRRRRTTNR